MKKLLGIKEVAEFLSVPEGTIRYWCFTKKIRYYKIGRHLRFDKEDLEKFLKSNLVEGGN